MWLSKEYLIVGGLEGECSLYCSVVEFCLDRAVEVHSEAEGAVGINTRVSSVMLVGRCGLAVIRCVASGGLRVFLVAGGLASGEWKIKAGSERNFPRVMLPCRLPFFRWSGGAKSCVGLAVILLPSGKQRGELGAFRCSILGFATESNQTCSCR